jgi:valyl-tRNA synthetase
MCKNKIYGAISFHCGVGMTPQLACFKSIPLSSKLALQFHRAHTRLFQSTLVSHFSTSPTSQQQQQQQPLGDYDPLQLEPKWQTKWTDAKLFTPPTTRASDASKFTMILPPPNVTGALHIGHALTVSIEDALVRWRRMSGDDVLWIPGLDHAGIATQSGYNTMLSSPPLSLSCS